MKIISGKYKGRKIYSLNSSLLRPTSGALKETLFNIINHNYPEFLMGKHFLDVFSGSGSIALEALSRGAESVSLVENNHLHYQLIKKNFHNLSAHIIYSNFFHTYKNLFPHFYSLVFIDPPYYLNLLPKTLNHLLSLNILTTPALIITESKKNTFNPHSQNIPSFLKLISQKTLGIKELNFLIYNNISS